MPSNFFPSLFTPFPSSPSPPLSFLSPGAPLPTSKLEETARLFLLFPLPPPFFLFFSFFSGVDGGLQSSFPGPSPFSPLLLPFLSGGVSAPGWGCVDSPPSGPPSPSLLPGKGAQQRRVATASPLDVIGILSLFPLLFYGTKEEKRTCRDGRIFRVRRRPMSAFPFPSPLISFPERDAAVTEEAEENETNVPPPFFFSSSLLFPSLSVRPRKQRGRSNPRTGFAVSPLSFALPPFLFSPIKA